MKIRPTKHLCTKLAAITLLAISFQSNAAGPLLVCEPGQPFLWPNGGVNVPFNPDQGALGILSNAEATQAVEDAFSAWQGVSTSTIS